MTDTFILPPSRSIPEPLLAFSPVNSAHQNIHPLRGLIEHGPFSQTTLAKIQAPIRVAMIAPKGSIGGLVALLNELRGTIEPRERKPYLPQFPGFQTAFRAQVVAAPERLRFELPPSLDKDLASHPQPRVLLAEVLTRLMQQLAPERSGFDVVLLMLPDRWDPWTYPTEQDDFDLHDFLKAISSDQRIPLQIVRDSGALAYQCRCSVAWRLSLALFVKAGGIPWKLATTETDTAFVGLSYALRKPTDTRRRFVTCCSQVFDADGSGPKFLLYNTEDARVILDNPFLSEAEMHRVVSRSLALYQSRHSRLLPKVIVVHKTTPFREEEVSGALSALSTVERVELVSIQQDTPWRGVKIDPPAAQGQKGRPANYPVERGTVVNLDAHSALLWSQGDVRGISAKQSYFKEGKGIPSPLLLRRHAGAGDVIDLCRQVLGLTKLDWNQDGLYSRLPVTLAYASVLAQVAKRIDVLSSQPYEFRYFM